MRIIKFRGKSKSANEWIYGYFSKATYCDDKGEQSNSI